MSETVDEIRQRYQDKMILEMTKFLTVYNQLSQSSINLEDALADYAALIRLLGNYVATLDVFQRKWLDTSIEFSDEIAIDMGVFRDTVWEKKVENFLMLLKKAFYSSLNDDISSYLEATTDFTDEEKVLCRLFWSKVDSLNQAMKKSTFNNLTREMMDRKNIASYSDELKAFNEFTQELAKTPERMHIVRRFDVEVKRLAATKTPSEVFFDV